MTQEATGMLFVLSTCGTPGQEEAFQRWYRTVHIPDVLATGIFLRASFWRAPAAVEGRPAFIAIYETANQDLDQVMAVIRESVPKWHSQGHANPDLKVLHTGTFQKLGAWDAPSS